jgi:hypothetical protein
MPVIPGGSLTDPTLATQPHATVGASCRSTSSNFMPLPSVSSRTCTCCAPAAAATSSASNATAQPLLVMTRSFPEAIFTIG